MCCFGGGYFFFSSSYFGSRSQSMRLSHILHNDSIYVILLFHPFAFVNIVVFVLSRLLQPLAQMQHLISNRRDKKKRKKSRGKKTSKRVGLLLIYAFTSLILFALPSSVRECNARSDAKWPNVHCNQFNETKL